MLFTTNCLFLSSLVRYRSNFFRKTAPDSRVRRSPHTLFSTLLGFCLLFSAFGSQAATLSGTAVAAPAAVDLTTEGTADWAHWGLGGAGSFNRKAGVTSQISNITLLGVGAFGYGGDAAWSAHSWSDGTPTVSQTATPSMLYWTGIGNGYSITVPADTSVRTLRLYLGGWSSNSRVDATLSDGSAPAFTQVVNDPNNVINQVVTLTFSAASAGQTLTVTHTLVNDFGVGNIALQAATLVVAPPPPLVLPFTDDFSSGTLNNWSVVDGTNTTSFWSVIAGELHQSNRVESVNAFQESYHLGTYAYLPAGSGLTDYRVSVDATYLATQFAEDIGIMFRYQDANNYYRLALNSRYGFTRLEKKVGGQFIPLATNARGFTISQLLQIVIELNGSSISVYVNGDPLFIVTDTSLTSGTVALYSQDDGKFDNVRIDPVTSAPSVIIASPLAHSVLTTTGSTLTVAALAANVPTNGYVDFVLDNSTLLSDNIPPYTQTFSAVGPGIHKVDAILRDQSAVELVRDTNVDVSTQGDYFIAVGDSINNGIGDYYAADNLNSLFGRIIAFRGYESLLADSLNTTNLNPTNIVFNEGIGGDETFDAAFTRIKSILDRHPGTNKVLILLGTNDSLAAIPPGLGCTGAACNGTFKGNLQTLVDKIRWADFPTNTVASNITPFVALTPPVFNAADPWTSTINSRIKNYNTAITGEIVGIQPGVDFFSFFLPSAIKNYRSLYSDTLHPNSLGYVMMANLWHNVLDPANSLPLPFILDDLIAGTGTGSVLQQNLIEAGDRYYLDETFTVSGSIPSVLLNGRWVVSNNADRGDTTGAYLSFNIDRLTDIYVAYDASVAVASLPTWMSGFADTGLTLGTTDSTTPILKLYLRSFPIGAVSLGGNMQGGANGANANYVAIVVEK